MPKAVSNHSPSRPAPVRTSGSDVDHDPETHTPKPSAASSKKATTLPASPVQRNNQDSQPPTFPSEADFHPESTLGNSTRPVGLHKADVDQLVSTIIEGKNNTESPKTSQDSSSDDEESSDGEESDEDEYEEFEDDGQPSTSTPSSTSSTADYSQILLRHSASKANVMKSAAPLLESESVSQLKRERDDAVSHAENLQEALEEERQQSKGLRSRLASLEEELKGAKSKCTCNAFGTNDGAASGVPAPSLATIKKLMNIIKSKDKEVQNLKQKLKSAESSSVSLQQSLQESLHENKTLRGETPDRENSTSRTRQRFREAQEMAADVEMTSAATYSSSRRSSGLLPDIHSGEVAHRSPAATNAALSDNIKRAAKNSTSRIQRELGEPSHSTLQKKPSSAAMLRHPTQVERLKEAAGAGESPRTAPAKHGTRPRRRNGSSSGSGILDAQTLYTTDDDLKAMGPIEALKMESQYAKLVKILSNPKEDSDGPFQRRLGALTTLRRLLLHHADDMRGLSRHDLLALTSGVLTSVNSLRSEAVKNGLLTLATLFSTLGTHADCCLDQILPTLVRKASVGSHFLIEEAVNVLHTLTTHSTHARLLGRLLQQRARFCNAKDAKVRHRVFLILGDLLETAGGAIAFRDPHMGKWLKPLASELCSKVSDSRAEVRAAVRNALYHLCSKDGDVDPSMLRDLVPSTQFDRARSALQQFLKHGTPKSRTTESKSPAGSPAKPKSHANRKRSTNGASSAECKAANEFIKTTRLQLDKKDWKTRAQSLQLLCESVTRAKNAFDPVNASNSSVATSNLFAFYDCVAAGIADGNSKVNAAALSGLSDVLGSMPPSGLSKIATQLLDLLVKVRGSKNRDVAQLGRQCLDKLLDRLAPARSVRMLVTLLDRKASSSVTGGKEGGSSVVELLDGLTVQMQRLASNGSSDSKTHNLVVKKVLPLVAKFVAASDHSRYAPLRRTCIHIYFHRVIVDCCCCGTCSRGRNHRRMGGKDQAALTQICQVLLSHAAVIAPGPAEKLASTFSASPSFEL